MPVWLELWTLIMSNTCRGESGLQRVHAVGAD